MGSLLLKLLPALCVIAPLGILVFMLQDTRAELDSLRSQIGTALTQALEETRQKEARLYYDNMQATNELSLQLSTIENAYATAATDLFTPSGLSAADDGVRFGDADVVDRLHHSTADSSGVTSVRGVATPTNRAGNAQTGQPPAKSSRLATDALSAKRLEQCKRELLYEAKEYDILATQYNALLRFYNNARKETLDYAYKD